MTHRKKGKTISSHAGQLNSIYFVSSAVNVAEFSVGQLSSAECEMTDPSRLWAVLSTDDSSASIADAWQGKNVLRKPNVIPYLQ